jgi:hypothetical protein
MIMAKLDLGDLDIQQCSRLWSQNAPFAPLPNLFTAANRHLLAPLGFPILPGWYSASQLVTFAQQGCKLGSERIGDSIVVPTMA